MFLILLIAFTIIPVVEIYLLIEVGQVIGTVETIFVILITGFMGASFARSQGQQVWLQTQKSIQGGQMPTLALLQGLMIFIGGILLVTPGFLTDFLGLSLIIPITRKYLALWLQNRLKNKVQKGQVFVYTNQPKWGNSPFESEKSQTSNQPPFQVNPGERDVTPKGSEGSSHSNESKSD